MARHSTNDTLRDDLARERDKVEDTIDEIQRRLSPSQLMDEVLRRGRGSGSELVENLRRTLVANPVPTALIGAGLLWLLLGPRTHAATGEKAKDGDPADWEI